MKNAIENGIFSSTSAKGYMNGFKDFVDVIRHMKKCQTPQKKRVELTYLLILIIVGQFLVKLKKIDRRYLKNTSSHFTKKEYIWNERILSVLFQN